MSDVVVETRELTKSYGSFVALERLNISVQRGHILGFIGPNGAGKTTTIKILVGLSRPTSGSASVAGVDCVADARKVKRLVGYMPDVFGSYDNMRVREYLDFFGAAYKIPRKERVKRIEVVMEVTGSGYMRDRFVDSLSHGMKQRVGIARTLLHDPPVLILDEPANGLDPTARVEMRQILLRLAQSGKTLIVTSHILPELSRICDTVAIITKGQLRAFGPLEQIMRGIRQRRSIEIQLLMGKDMAKCESLAKKAFDAADEITHAEEESTLRVRTAASDEALSAFLSQLVGQGVKVTQFREVHQDLEDAFLEVTKHDEGGSGDRMSSAAVVR
ncbi:MAG: ABC transporter ATP-binding protein [Phycisphaerales bacterium]|nr:ABC transporter ATP-binding protein [Phycisphaerales bacterium]